MTELQSPSEKNNNATRDNICKKTQDYIDTLSGTDRSNAMKESKDILMKCIEALPPIQSCVISSTTGTPSPVSIIGGVNSNGSSSAGFSVNLFGAAGSTSTKVIGGQCPNTSPNIPSYEHQYRRPPYGGNDKYGSLGGGSDSETERTSIQSSPSNEKTSPLPTPAQASKSEIGI